MFQVAPVSRLIQAFLGPGMTPSIGPPAVFVFATVPDVSDQFLGAPGIAVPTWRKVLPFALALLDGIEVTLVFEVTLEIQAFDCRVGEG